MAEEKPPKKESDAGQQEPAYRLGTPFGVTSVQMLSSLQLQTLGQALDRCVALWGDRDLVVFPHRRLRAGALRAEADRLADGLLSLGVLAGEHVAVWLPNAPEYVAAEFALAKIGAVLVPVNTRYHAAELEHVLRQSHATTLLLAPQLASVDCINVLREICPEWHEGSRAPAYRGALPHLQRAVTVGGRAPGLLAYEDVLERGDTSEFRSMREAREALAKPEDVMILQYTSGTTGFPKAVMLAHGQVLRNAWQLARRAGLGAADRVLSAIPMFHVGGAVCALLGAVSTGYTLYLTPVFDPGESLRIIEEEKITAYIGLESMFTALRAHVDFPKRSRATLSKGWSEGTAPFLRMVAEEMGIRNHCSLYGLSEASPNVTITDWRDPQEKRLHSMGRPQAGVEVKIFNVVTGATASGGERGEICVRGWSVMKGYYQQPEETAKVIDAEGWLHTGDLGYLGPDGYLTWTGRLKEMLRVGDETVSTLEIENLLCTHPAIQAAAVVGIPDKDLNEVPVACVQLRPDKQAKSEEIIEFCRSKVAAFKVPRLIHIVTDFEMTGSGKIQKFTLRDRFLKELDKGKS